MTRPLTFDRVRDDLVAALGPHEGRRLAVPGFRPASVLIPILDRPGGPTVLFTQRTRDVRHHKGQVSFPGGGLEHGEDAVTAALREAWEEVGLAAEATHVVGVLDDHPTVSSYVVTPVVGVVTRPPERFVAQEREVARPFEVPLSRLLDRRHVRAEWWDSGSDGAIASTILATVRGHAGAADWDAERGRYRVLFFDAGLGPDSEIWGLSARILHDLLVRVWQVADPAVVERQRRP